MSLIPRSSLFDFDNFFDNFFAPSATSRLGDKAFFAPRIDVKENKKHYEITTELPGVKKEDVRVTLDNGILTIEAESKQEDKEEKDGKIIRQERRYGKYVRSFTVGDGVKQGDIVASFENGILTVKAPKSAAKQQKATQIAIS